MQSLPKLIARLLGPVANLGVRPDDPEEVRLQKALLVGGSLFVLPVSVIWALLYFTYDEPLAGAVTAAYVAVIGLSLLYLTVSGREKLLSTVQLLCTLVLPFLLTIILGGFMNAMLGRIPTSGDHFEWNGLDFEVVDMDGQRVDKVLLQPVQTLTMMEEPEEGSA